MGLGFRVKGFGGYSIVSVDPAVVAKSHPIPLPGLGIGVEGLGFGVWGSGVRIQGLVFTV